MLRREAAHINSIVWFDSIGSQTHESSALEASMPPMIPTNAVNFIDEYFAKHGLLQMEFQDFKIRPMFLASVVLALMHNAPTDLCNVEILMSLQKTS